MPSFTSRWNGGKVRALVTKVLVAQSYDPKTTRLETVPHLEVQAIWDTGATNSVITKRAAQACGLKPTGMVMNHSAHGVKQCATYLVTIGLPNHVLVSDVKVTEVDSLCGGDIDALIGMDIISRGDFAVTHGQGSTVFSFRLPSATEIDFVKEAKTPVKETHHIGRNSRCPCGSGKKYKQCCGKEQ